VIDHLSFDAVIIIVGNIIIIIAIFFVVVVVIGFVARGRFGRRVGRQERQQLGRNRIHTLLGEIIMAIMCTTRWMLDIMRISSLMMLGIAYIMIDGHHCDMVGVDRIMVLDIKPLCIVRVVRVVRHDRIAR